MDSIPWVRCASGNVSYFSEIQNISFLYKVSKSYFTFVSEEKKKEKSNWIRSVWPFLVSLQSLPVHVGLLPANSKRSESPFHNLFCFLLYHVTYLASIIKSWREWGISLKGDKSQIRGRSFDWNFYLSEMWHTLHLHES